MPVEILFYTMLAFFFTHELDAIKNHEWRVFPLLSSLPERLGERLFVWLHPPLFLGILWFAGSNPNSGFSQMISGFSIVHVGLHAIFRNHPHNEFNTLESWVLIIAAGFFGFLHLISVSI